MFGAKRLIAPLPDRDIVEGIATVDESFVDRMIALVEGAQRRKTPNEIALTILLAALRSSSCSRWCSAGPRSPSASPAAVPRTPSPRRRPR
jgi:K+-transporting ATPase ATPase B chain